MNNKNRTKKEGVVPEGLNPLNFNFRAYSLKIL